MRRTLLLFVVLGALLLAPTAALASGQEVIADCADNARIDGDHGPQDYADALSNLPSDLDEYTDCRQIISEARANPPQQSNGGGGGDGIDGGGGNGGGDGGGSGGSAGSSGGSQAPGASNRRQPAAPGPRQVPDSSTLASKPVQRGIPLPLLLVIGLLILGALTALVASVARRRRRGTQELTDAGAEAPTDTQPDRLAHRVFPRRA